MPINKRMFVLHGGWKRVRCISSVYPPGSTTAIDFVPCHQHWRSSPIQAHSATRWVFWVWHSHHQPGEVPSSDIVPSALAMLCSTCLTNFSHTYPTCRLVFLVYSITQHKHSLLNKTSIIQWPCHTALPGISFPSFPLGKIPSHTSQPSQEC